MLQTERSLHAPFHILSRCPKTSDQSCHLAIPDTLFYQHGSLRIWYTTDDTGEVMKRDRRECTKERILEVFCGEDGAEVKAAQEAGGTGPGSTSAGHHRGAPGVPVAIYMHYNSAAKEANQNGTLFGPSGRKKHATETEEPSNYASFSGDAEPLSVDFFDQELLRNFLSTRDNKHNVIVQRYVFNPSQHASVVQVIWSPHKTITMLRQNINTIYDTQMPLRDRCSCDESCAFSREVKATPKMMSRMSGVCQKIVEHWYQIEQKQIMRMVLFFCFDKLRTPVFMWASEIQVTQQQLSLSDANRLAQFNTRRSLLQLSPLIAKSDVKFFQGNGRGSGATSSLGVNAMRSRLSTKMASVLTGETNVSSVLEALDETFQVSRQSVSTFAATNYSTGSKHHSPPKAKQLSPEKTAELIYGKYARRPNSAFANKRGKGVGWGATNARSSSALGNSIGSRPPSAIQRKGTQASPGADDLSHLGDLSALKNFSRQTSPCTAMLTPTSAQRRTPHLGTDDENLNTSQQRARRPQSPDLERMAAFWAYLQPEVGAFYDSLQLTYQSAIDCVSDLIQGLSISFGSDAENITGYFSTPLTPELKEELMKVLSTSGHGQPQDLVVGLQVTESDVSFSVVSPSGAREVARKLRMAEKEWSIVSLILRRQLLLRVKFSIEKEIRDAKHSASPGQLPLSPASAARKRLSSPGTGQPDRQFSSASRQKTMGNLSSSISARPTTIGAVSIFVPLPSEDQSKAVCDEDSMDSAADQEQRQRQFEEDKQQRLDAVQSGIRSLVQQIDNLLTKFGEPPSKETKSSADLLNADCTHFTASGKHIPRLSNMEFEGVGYPAKLLL